MSISTASISWPWPQVNDRVVLAGRVDEIAPAGGAVYVELDEAQCLSSPHHARALVRVGKYLPVPELTGHILLASQWREGSSRNQVMLIGSIVDEDRDHGLVRVEFVGTLPSGQQLVFGREHLIFGKVRGG
ncbi:MAG TPA: hypothetical protein VGR71_16790 [Nitrospira sp.]|nr:hypothetical protein [Nitrospira sp.]